MTHRGPNARGQYVGGGIGLGHTRLALVDLDPRSNQPFCDETGRYQLVYNGEVYNFRALRAELERRGVRFRTASDTEVVLQALIHFPAEEALLRLEGMFALAIYDCQTRNLLLARDRFGMKPLLWAGGRNNEEPLLFASQADALAPWQPLEPDIATLTGFLLGHGGPMAGPSFYRNISSLPPGSILRVGPGRAPEISSFFGLTDFLDADEAERLAGLSRSTLVDEADALLRASTRLHLAADASIGAFCSGGIDSSLLAAMAARDGIDVKLFHAEVKGRWSERHAAEALARHLGLDLQVVEVADQDFVDLMAEVTLHYGQPFSYHPNCAPMMMVSQLARDAGVRGLLSGEGSDELFLGYPWLGRKRLTDAWDRLREASVARIRSVPEIGNLVLPVTGKNHAEVLDITSRREISADAEKVAKAVAALPRASTRRAARWSLDLMHHHLRTLLHRNDTMGMSRSIESRFPFLDHGLVRTAVNMPARAKLSVSPRIMDRAHPFVRDKWVVREVARRYLPPELSQRVKLGFWTTVFQRMSVDEGYFAGSPLADLYRLPRGAIRAILDGEPSEFVSRLVHADVWLRVLIDGEQIGSVRDRLRRSCTVRQETGRRVG